MPYYNKPNDTAKGELTLKIAHLYYFIVTANSHSINKAAHRLFISQQQLSRIIASLEEAVHAQLLVRNAMGVELTEKGRVFLLHAEKIVAEYKKLQHYFRLDTLPPLGENAFALQGQCQIVVPVFFSLFLDDFMQKFSAQYPEIKLRCLEQSERYSSQAFAHFQGLHLSAGNLTSPILKDTTPANENAVIAYTIGQFTSGWCINHQSSLTRKSVLTMEEIYAQPRSDFPWRLWSVEQTYDANIIFVSTNIQQHLNSVIQGRSIFPIPTYIMPYIQAHCPEIIVMPDTLQLPFALNLMHSSTYILTAADKALMHFVVQYLQDGTRFKLTGRL